MRSMAAEGIITALNRSRIAKILKSGILKGSGNGGIGFLSSTAGLSFMLAKKAMGSKLMVQGRF